MIADIRDNFKKKNERKIVVKVCHAEVVLELVSV